MYSLRNYQCIIKSFIKEGFAFYPLGEAHCDLSRKVVFLRHDIDYSLRAAYQIAKANHSMGVRACFCLQLNNVLYNLLEEKNQDLVRRIVELGHTVGLHFSLPQNIRTITGEALENRVEEMILEDVDRLRKLLNVEVQPVMSWHNPSVLGERYARFVRRPVPGLTNAYALIAEGLEYCSDSNHRFSVDEWVSKAETCSGQVHLLFHPFQWIYDSDRMEQVLSGIWKDIIRNMETVFLTNHIYRRHFPEGMPEEGLDSWVNPLHWIGHDAH